MGGRAIWILPIAFLVAGFTAEDGDTQAQIEVEVNGLRNATGMLRCSLFASAGGFPGTPQRAASRVDVEPSPEGSVCLFTDVESGTYAVAIHHDEDEDGQMKVQPPGYPVEGRGASNNPDIRRAPPRFSDAAFTVEGGSVQLEIEVVY